MAPSSKGKLENATEVTAAQAQIEWGVHLVNRKAAAQRFANGQNNGGRRNNATGNDQTDQALIIDPGLRRIKNGDAPVALNGGAFKGIPVPLGRLEIQADGRLLVIGAEGKSRSANGAPLPNTADFADNDNWHDDMGDGPVTARVTIGGNTVDAKPAWVVVAPPDFAPAIVNVITMYDALTDLAVQRAILEAPPTIFFDQHILPILERALGMQWVNRQARLGYDDTQSGGHSPNNPSGDFSSMLTELGNPALPNIPRLAVFRLMRNPAGGTFPATVPALKRMPRLNDNSSSGNVLPLTRLQYRSLELWSQGTFQKTNPAPAVELLPDALTRVALEACTGGAFFPGIEAGRVMVEAGRYMDGEPYRLSHAQVKPGEITARNAVPWQADFRLCRWEEGPKLGWWPAQRPDDVLRTADGEPKPWARNLPDTYQALIDNWHRLGFVKEDPANPGVFIEHDRTLPEP